ncbi:uncharacterized protein LOC127790949 [Diospyros lotus]|uniref:uncharacterized protein LOC127790949 n=1 Tax=Diospyros lotus TaxID=55363 RepID=UPI002258C752|nr:uncharacterized protein LOC127790949 [Diospyros lotus]
MVKDRDHQLIMRNLELLPRVEVAKKMSSDGENSSELDLDLSLGGCYSKSLKDNATTVKISLTSSLNGNKKKNGSGNEPFVSLGDQKLSLLANPQKKEMQALRRLGAKMRLLESRRRLIMRGHLAITTGASMKDINTKSPPNISITGCGGFEWGKGKGPNVATDCVVASHHAKDMQGKSSNNLPKFATNDPLLSHAIVNTIKSNPGVVIRDPEGPNIVNAPTSFQLTEVKGKGKAICHGNQWHRHNKPLIQHFSQSAYPSSYHLESINMESVLSSTKHQANPTNESPVAPIMLESMVVGSSSFAKTCNSKQEVAGSNGSNQIQVAETTQQQQEGPSKRVRVSTQSERNAMNVINGMPIVTTSGGHPNGKEIKGILYKFLKEQVTIVCLCHGTFLTPAEFVKHAGGDELDNPMKLILVSKPIM